MRILFDENVDRRLRRELPGFEVKTVPEMGWAGTVNGELLTLADASFDVLITADRNLRHQQNLAQLRRITIIILVATHMDLEGLNP